jgi:signal transduction histidine kinase
VTTPLRSAARVAGVVTAVAAVLYIAAAVVLLVLTQINNMNSTDQQLRERLSQEQGSRPPPPDHDGQLYGPCYTWHVASDGSVAASADAPKLPPSLHSVRGPTTAQVMGADYRFVGAPSGSGWLVVGEGLGSLELSRTSLLASEALAFVPLMLLVFGASLLVGRASAKPIDEARQRLVEFTADASHELRTPLQIIQVELNLALRRPRERSQYEDSLRRISGEAGHMRQLIEDLLWLARFDSRGRGEVRELVDLGAVAASVVQRFEGMAAERSQQLTLSTLEREPASVSAPGAWVERLLGVLVDNANRYTPVGGRIRVAVEMADGAPLLRVEDSGPGMAEEEWDRIFDRFHRASTDPGGSGLGLAIADAIVSATHGRWQLSRSELGGASFTVRWPVARRGAEYEGSPHPAG